jgi:hypothetical protein
MGTAETKPSSLMDRLSPKFCRERDAFRALLPSLLAEYDGKFVAVHEGKVVDSGDDQIAVARRCYAKFGYIPIYVGKVSSTPIPPALIPSPSRVHS